MTDEQHAAIIAQAALGLNKLINAASYDGLKIGLLIRREGEGQVAQVEPIVARQLLGKIAPSGFER